MHNICIKNLSEVEIRGGSYQARRNEIHIGGGAEMRCKRSEQERGSGGLSLGKFFTTTPFRWLENAPFFENVLLTEAKELMRN